MEAFNETGEARELRFREKDHFKEVALAYNKIVERLSPKI